MSSDTMASTASATIAELNRQVASMRQQMIELQGTGMARMSGRVQSHPIASLLVAFGIGVVGGQLLRR